MDYLVRDTHYTGVAFGVVDYNRLINKMDFYEDRLVVEQGGLRLPNLSLSHASG